MPGVAGKGLPPPGVVIIEDGSAKVRFGGGVDGGSIRLLFRGGLAGEGDAARYRRRSAPSSPFVLLLVLLLLLLESFFVIVLLPRFFLSRLRLRIGGVRGGDMRIEWWWLAWWNEWVGRSSSSSEFAA